jgi:cytoskeletal protein CcmA (bactofilin family)
MNSPWHVGPTISIKGEVISREPLTIAGHVNGSVEVVGHALTIAEGGRVAATLLANSIVVSGAVKGSLSAKDNIVVAETAVVEGDLAAPSVRVADGAVMQGRIDTGDRKAKKSNPAS